MLFLAFTAFVLLYTAARNACRLYPSEPCDARHPLLLIAHPDDESMFFTPLLCHTRPFILCLSSGDADGLGSVRRRELAALCAAYGLEHEVLDYEDGASWSTRRIVADLIPRLNKHKADTVFTFDEHGVSQHHNHISCYRAAKALERLVGTKACSFNYLRSTSLFSKYFVDLGSKQYYAPFMSMLCLSNMLQHRSQMVWFRYIYCFLSNYACYNDFV
ncbi:N-acetylglucosaminylphosphatidylinositol deacetylase [Pancytospora philotis]|nr:N-acetylglucosaminylphosphatidylinositol deacetylase [Pancytospora philotis]